MNGRRLGRSGFTVSEIGFGAWAVGGGWGRTDDAVRVGRVVQEERVRSAVLERRRAPDRAQLGCARQGAVQCDERELAGVVRRQDERRRHGVLRGRQVGHGGPAPGEGQEIGRGMRHGGLLQHDLG